MTEHEQLARTMLQESGINENLGEIWDYCLKEALQYDEEQLKLSIGFYRIIHNKNQQPWKTKYRLLGEYLGVGMDKDTFVRQLLGNTDKLRAISELILGPNVEGNIMSDVALSHGAWAGLGMLIDDITKSLGDLVDEFDDLTDPDETQAH